jgi:hypothetical protein
MDIFYRCSKCKQEFTSTYDCTAHEKDCIKLEDTIGYEIKDVWDKLAKEYNLEVIDLNVQVYTQGCDDFDQYWNYVDARCTVKMANGIDFKFHYGNNVDSYEGKDTLRKIIEEEYIFPRLTTTYEGRIIQHDDYSGWISWKIGEIDVHDIMRRFEGKNVKIEVCKG